MSSNIQFQAKEIQQMLEIKKHRYEYLASKIGITPEVAEVEGRGHAHLYSFKNALQFAFAHYGNLQGLSPGVLRDMLKVLDEINEPQDYPIYDPTKQIDLRFYFITYTGMGDGRKVWETEYFALGGAVGATNEFSFTPFSREEHLELDPYKIPFSGPGQGAKYSSEKAEMEAWLSAAEAYLAVNLGVIKKRVLHYLRR